MIHRLIPTPRPTLLVLTQFGVGRLPERLRDEAQRLGRADLQLQELVRDERRVVVDVVHTVVERDVVAAYAPRA